MCFAIAYSVATCPSLRRTLAFISDCAIGSILAIHGIAMTRRPASDVAAALAAAVVVSFIPDLEKVPTFAQLLADRRW
jgi:hypothetical protein